MFTPVRARHFSPRTDFYPGDFNPLKNTRIYLFADHIDQFGTNDQVGGSPRPVVEDSIPIEKTLLRCPPLVQAGPAHLQGIAPGPRV